MSHNKLKTFDRNIFQGLINLQEIDISCNELKLCKRHSTIFHGLVNLEFLNLEHNQLKSIEADMFHGLNSLKYLK